MEYRLKLDVDSDGVFHGAESYKKTAQRDKPGRCKICKTPISIYRMGDYCGIHQFEGILILDEIEEKKRDMRNMSRRK